MRDRKMVKAKEYGISQKKYAELKYFCAQYREKKLQAAAGDELRQRDIEQIEQAAKSANAEIYEYILKNVTEGIPYEYMAVPCGRRQFYEARRLFFLLLSEKR